MSVLASLQPLLACAIVGLALILWIIASAATAWFWARIITNRDARHRSMQNHPTNRINRGTENKENRL